MTSLYFGLHILTLLSFVGFAHGYPEYRRSIPNGENVPHPCKPNSIWEGVGHQSVAGGGNWNPFGRDFESAGCVWTAELCNSDSDSDGLTNGEELGDPDCVWDPPDPYTDIWLGTVQPGMAPDRTYNISHPGICEPTTSAHCLSMNSWGVDCSGGEGFTCPGTEANDAVNMILTMNRTRVSADETSYTCQTFSLSHDTLYHLIGYRAHLDNSHVVNGITLYGCSDQAENYRFVPECIDYRKECTTVLGSWSVGDRGECYPENAGFLIGNGSITRVMMEIQYHNPQNIPDYEDESGVTLFLTPAIREDNLGSLLIGQNAINIPPRRSAVEMNAVCPSYCTHRKFNDTVYITKATLRMHKLAVSGKLEHWRGGSRLNVLYEKSVYSYDRPVHERFSPGLEFRPGDELYTECHYESMSRSEVTYRGWDISEDEMCYGFLTYYPAENGPEACVSWEGQDQCELDDFVLGGGSEARLSITVMSLLILAHLIV